MDIAPKKAAQILIADLFLAIINFHFHFPKLENLAYADILEIGFVTGEIYALLKDDNLNTEVLFERTYFLFDLLDNLGGDEFMHDVYLADFILLIDAAKQGKAMPAGVSPSSRYIIKNMSDEPFFPSKAITVNAGFGTIIGGRIFEAKRKNFKNLH